MKELSIKLKLLFKLTEGNMEGETDTNQSRMYIIAFNQQ